MKSSFITSSSPSTSKKSNFSCRKNSSIRPKLFKWNHEEPRANSEYINKKFNESQNEIAPELRVIGGLGQIRCLEKSRVKRQRLINRPTQVQNISHTKTKLLPNFPLTEQLRPVVCPPEQQTQAKNIFEHAERVKFAENLLPPPQSTHFEYNQVENDTKRKFDHENPFNLDLKGLSKYQRQKSAADEAERRKNYEIMRRTMETKKLKTEGKEKIKQQERDEKYGLPKLFNVCANQVEEDADDDDEDAKTEQCSSSSTLCNLTSTKCKLVPMMEKPNVSKASQRHYKNKEDKLRRQVKEENTLNVIMAKENARKAQDDEEKFIFQLADKSYPPSEDCIDDEKKLQMRLSSFPPAYTKFDYPVNESELYELQRKLNSGESLNKIKVDGVTRLDEDNYKEEEIGISCGEKIENRVILRSFHDRMHREPRGKINLHVKEDKESTCLTHQQWLDAISNDPQITREPPRVKLLSCLKPSREPNNDKTILFERDSSSKKIDLASIESPIKQHIRKIDEKLKQRHRYTRMTSKIKKNIDEEERKKQMRRMNFMGIPISTSNADVAKKCKKQNEIEKIVKKISSKTSLEIDDKFISTKGDGGVVKFFPTIPQYQNDETSIEKCNRQQSILFKKAKPRCNDPKYLRIDKSLPYIDMEQVKNMKVIENQCESSLQHHNAEKSEEKFPSIAADKEKNQMSAIKKSFNKIIEKKLQDYKIQPKTDIVSEMGDSKVQSIESATTTLSSEGTLFSNDSGSYLMILDEKIPKTQLNIAHKFQNRSLVTIQEQLPYERIPYLMCDMRLMKKLVKVPDRFHTHLTRSSANIRERVKVDSPNYEDELMGDDNMKFPSQLATDADDAYINEFFNHRSRTQYRFPRRTEMVQLREIVRRKMDSYYIQEKFILDQIHSENEEKNMKELQKKIEVYQNFLEECQETIHRKTMRTTEQVKSYYQATDTLRNQHEKLYNQVEPLKMQIFYQANEFILRMTYEDIQYLLKPIEWRLEYDHLHRKRSGELENFQESIEQRGVRNIWNRESATVETIMDFINSTYSSNKSPQKIKLFINGSDFLKAYKNLRLKSFKVLEKFTYAALMLTKLEYEMKEVEEKSEKFVVLYETSTKCLFHRWSFMQSRVDEIKTNSMTLMAKPLEESFGAPLLQDVTALCSHLFNNLFASSTGGESTKYIDVNEKFGLIEGKVLGLLAALDEIPRSTIDEVEKQVRALNKKKMRIAERAYKIELNIEFTMTQLSRLLAKPEKRIISRRKVTRSVLRKPPPKTEKIVPVLSSLEEKYAKAFMELTGERENIKFDESVREAVKKIKHDLVPFYLDHYLEKKGFKIGKLNELQVEDILKDEEKLFKFKDVIPNVRKQVKIWEELSDVLREKNLKRTEYLYK